jgi:hypothetical protein
MITTLAASLICCGIVMDFFSLIRGIRRLRGEGPSAIPLVPLLFYALAVVWLGNVFPFYVVLTIAVGLLIIHFLCQFLVLAVLDRTLP